MESHLLDSVRVEKGQVCDGIDYIQCAHLVRWLLVLRYDEVCLLLSFNTRLNKTKLFSYRRAQDTEAGWTEKL